MLFYGIINNVDSTQKTFQIRGFLHGVYFDSTDNVLSSANHY